MSQADLIDKMNDDDDEISRDVSESKAIQMSGGALNLLVRAASLEKSIIMSSISESLTCNMSNESAECSDSGAENS